MQIFQLPPSIFPTESQLFPHNSPFIRLFGFSRRFVIPDAFSANNFHVIAPVGQGLAKSTVQVVCQCVYFHQIAFFAISPTR